MSGPTTGDLFELRHADRVKAADVIWTCSAAGRQIVREAKRFRTASGPGVMVRVALGHTYYYDAHEWVMVRKERGE